VQTVFDDAAAMDARASSHDEKNGGCPGECGTEIREGVVGIKQRLFLHSPRRHRDTADTINKRTLHMRKSARDCNV
jgi:hypothetical protein